jgi:uncharacterized protein (TIGR03083 family)
MNARERLVAFEARGARLGRAAAEAGLDARVPTCPEWTVRDLVRHVGGVHRWATVILGERRTEEYDGDLEDLSGGWPTDAGLLAWYDESHRRLAETLRNADPDVDYWRWRPTGTAYEFWVNRMCHETTVHSIDADLAAGMQPELAEDLAVDGIDDLVVGVVGGRQAGADVGTRRTLVLRTPDDSAEWWTSFDATGFAAGRGAAPAADATVTGPAAMLYRLVWHRAGLDEVETVGDPQVVEDWWRNVDIRWA